MSKATSCPHEDLEKGQTAQTLKMPKPKPTIYTWNKEQSKDHSERHRDEDYVNIRVSERDKEESETPGGLRSRSKTFAMRYQAARPNVSLKSGLTSGKSKPILYIYIFN